MSKMISYKVKMPRGQITIDQLLQIMDAMGLKPQLHDTNVEVESFTKEDSARGNLEFNTSVLGGGWRQQTGVATVNYNKETRIIEGSLQLEIDSWGVEGRVNDLATNLSNSLSNILKTITKVAEASKQTYFRIPGLTTYEVKEMFAALGGRMASQELIEGGQDNEHHSNLASTYLNRRQMAKQQQVSKSEKNSQQNLSDLLQISNKPKKFTITIPSPNGNIEMKLGYIPPVAEIREIKGGVEIILPEIFLPDCKQQLENMRNLGIALRAAEAQAKQHVGNSNPITHIEIQKGTLTTFKIDWEKPAENGLSQTAQDRIAQRAQAVQDGKVIVSDEQRVLIAKSSKPKSINTDALKQQVIKQAQEAGISHFVYA